MQVTSQNHHPAPVTSSRQLTGWLLVAALATAFVFLLDELLGWLGWQLMQTPLLDALAIFCALLLIPAAVQWALSHHMDWLDRGGTIAGCAIGGAFLACYTVYPPAGVVTLLIFALSVLYAMASPEPQHLMAVTVMVLAFVAVSMMINDWRHGDEYLVHIDPQPQHIYYTTQQADFPQTQTVYECQRPGIFCTITEDNDNAPALQHLPAQSSLLSGGAGADFDARSR
jgi:hypothetical protein